MPRSVSTWDRLEHVLAGKEIPTRDLARFRSFISRVSFGAVDSLRERLQQIAVSRNIMLRGLYSFLEFLACATLFLLYYACVFLFTYGQTDPYPDIFPEKKK